MFCGNKSFAHLHNCIIRVTGRSRLNNIGDKTDILISSDRVLSTCTFTIWKEDQFFLRYKIQSGKMNHLSLDFSQTCLHQDSFLNPYSASKYPTIYHKYNFMKHVYNHNYLSLSIFMKTGFYKVLHHSRIPGLHTNFFFSTRGPDCNL